MALSSATFLSSSLNMSISIFIVGVYIVYADALPLRFLVGVIIWRGLGMDIVSDNSRYPKTQLLFKI